MIEKIEMIKNYEAFKEFSWNASVESFKQFNLIYGWNGSGKTSLSRVFKLLEDKQNPNGSEIKIKIDGSSRLLSDMIATEQVPMIRVFNKDYVEDTVFKDNSKVKPIFYLSKGNKDKAIELEARNKEFYHMKEKYQNEEKALSKARKVRDDYCISIAKVIRETLRSAGKTNKYINYDKGRYDGHATLMLGDKDYKNMILDVDTLNSLKLQTQAIEMPEHKAIIEFQFDWVKFENDVKDVLAKNVKMQLIQRLVDNPSLGKWVKTGMTEFLVDNNLCPFCTQNISENILSSLKSHFNEEYNDLANEIEELKMQIQASVTRLKSYTLPSSVLLYPTISREYEAAKTAMEEYIVFVVKHFSDVSKWLESKLEDPTTIIASRACEYKELDSKIQNVNAIIASHNEQSRNLQNNIESARDKVAMHYIAESLGVYIKNDTEVVMHESALNTTSGIVKSIKLKIDELETQLRDHRPPVNELNKEIEVFFSRGDIKFELEGNGYKITRNGEVVRNLSDGESSAIAILYFLKSLNVSETECHKCTVVIDDPVSSQDINNLYSTFVYIMKKSERVEQLILLTHNFNMFKYAKKWAKSRFKNEERSFYQVSCETTLVGSKYSKQIELSALPTQLLKFDSEYHYLFSIIYQYANGNTSASDEQQLFYGNIARKIIETFLEFKYPDGNELKDKYLRLKGFDEVKQMRIFRYINNVSHKALLEDYEPALMSVTKQVMIDVLDLIAYYDKVHYDSFVKISS
ncbi:AAA family ATPase [Candidatus Cloacimonadaceae bacterium]